MKAESRNTHLLERCSVETYAKKVLNALSAKHVSYIFRISEVEILLNNYKNESATSDHSTNSVVAVI